MAKIDITKTELVWPGKYNEDGTLKEVPHVSLPFQVIETVNESRASREAQKSGVQGGLFDIYEGNEGDTFEEGWRNKLIWGDNLLVMGSLLEKLAGKIDLIYIDPPFASGKDFSFTTAVGENDLKITKEQSLIEDKAYRDTWGHGLNSYLIMMRDRLACMRELLKPTGSIYVHVDDRVAFHLKIILDEIFGDARFQNAIVWHYSGWNKPNSSSFMKRHDTLLYYSHGDTPSFRGYSIPYASEEEYLATRKQKVHTDSEGRRFTLDTRDGGNRQVRIYIDEALSRGRPADDVWDVDKINNSSRELVGYETQKPEELLHRVLEASSEQGDLVLDAFCGSGTTLAVAEKLGRRWIGCDLGRWGIHVSRKRLLGIENCKPFEVLNLGKYERKYWQGVTFGKSKEKPLAEQALYEYLAFILKLYGAQPVAGLTHLHGKKAKAVIHIGAVDAPVTIAEIDAAVDECISIKQVELHVLGWEWEMGLYDLMVDAAKKKGVKLLLLQIPREVMEQQAAAKGDVRFFELAYLEADIQMPQKLTAQVALKDFVIPNTELIPEEVRSKISKWSDYIDYWAVDWDFQNDTFMQGWVAYRTRKERKLPLVSDSHAYDQPGKCLILVKVIDIFGNDTSQAFEVEVK